MTNEYYINEFINFFKSIDRSKNTIDTYVKIINMFFKFNNNKNTCEVTKQDIRAFLGSLGDKSSATINLYLRAINAYFEVLINDLELLDMKTAPTSGVRVPKLKTKHRNALSKEQIHTLIRCSKNIRDKAIITLMFNTGLRIHELIALTVEQFNNRDEYNGINLKVTKGSKERIIYLDDKTIDIINEYLKVRKDSEYDNLFISNGGLPMNDSCIRKTLKTIARRSSEFTDEEIKSLCNHTIRHSFANELEKSGVPLEIISNSMGHSNIQTTMIYLDLNRQNIRKAMCSVNV